MQKVVAYYFERSDGLTAREARRIDFEKCLGVVKQWLVNKGGKLTDTQTGCYRAEDGLEALFSWDAAQDGEREWQLLRLDETATDDTRHIATVTVIDTGARIAVYVSILAGVRNSTIRPIRIDPKCPRVVRSLLDCMRGWFHGPSELHTLQKLAGKANGEALAKQITDPSRTVPIITISEDTDTPILPGLGGQVAYDLAGLANVYIIDGDVSWELTRLLGKRLSCFAGGVRVYWPKFTLQADPFSHPLWTESRLSEYAGDRSAIESLRRQLRFMLMQAAARTVIEPTVIGEIQAASRTRVLAALHAKAESTSDYEKIAQDYATENDKLRQENADLKQQLEAAQSQLSTAQQNAELMANYQSQSTVEETAVAPDGPTDDNGPQDGDVRFYKKTGSKGKYDRMVIVPDCGCNCWQGANKADKAEKGIARLEGRNDWKNIFHCGKCTGGGVWKVRW